MQGALFYRINTARLFRTQSYLRFSAVFTILATSLIIGTFSHAASDNNSYRSVRDYLPNNSLAYFRLPVVSNELGKNKHYLNSADRHTADKAQKALQLLRQDISSALTAALPVPQQQATSALINLLIAHLEQPLELAINPSSNPNIPMPELLISAGINIDPQSFSKNLDQLAKATPMLMYSAKLNADHYGTLLVSGLPLQFRFHQGEFIALAGAGATIDKLEAAFSSQTDKNSHPMAKQEQSVDDSAKGLFLWLNTADIFTLLNNMGAKAQLEKLKNIGLDALQELAIGMGRVDNKGRMLISGSFSQARSLLPSVNNRFEFFSSGTPKSLVNISIPSAAIVEKWIDTAGELQSKPGAENHVRIQEKKLGFKFADFPAALGPELSFFQDQTGRYLALKVRNRKQFSKLIKKLTKKKYIEYSTRRVNKQTYHHMAIASLTQFSEQAIQKTTQDDPASAMLLRILFGKTHLFWIEENDYLIISSVPQALAQRVKSKPDTSVAKWLTTDQKQDFNQSLIAFTGDINQLPNEAYYLYLSRLLSVADASESTFDIYQMPDTLDLALSDSAAFGGQLDANPTAFSFSLNYEDTPADILAQGAGMEQAFVIGIIAAVAIPAYQDYVLRAKINDAFSHANTLKVTLSDYQQTQGRYPSESAILELNPTRSGEHFVLNVQANTGVIVISLRGNKNLEGATVTITPSGKGKDTKWLCSTSASHVRKYLPTYCRN